MHAAICLSLQADVLNFRGFDNFTKEKILFKKTQLFTIFTPFSPNLNVIVLSFENIYSSLIVLSNEGKVSGSSKQWKPLSGFEPMTDILQVRWNLRCMQYVTLRYDAIVSRPNDFNSTIFC